MRAVTPDEWKELRRRGMEWEMNADWHVRLEDPTTSRVVSAPTLKLAYDQIIN